MWLVKPDHLAVDFRRMPCTDLQRLLFITAAQLWRFKDTRDLLRLLLRTSELPATTLRVNFQPPPGRPPGGAGVERCVPRCRCCGCGSCSPDSAGGFDGPSDKHVKDQSRPTDQTQIRLVQSTPVQFIQVQFSPVKVS